MRTIFQSGIFSCDAEIFSVDNACVVRFFRQTEEQYRTPLSDLVIAASGLGYLYLKFVDGGAVLSGFLDSAYFSKDMVEDLLSFLEKAVPECRNCYLPYHIDFISMLDYDEYNGEY